jgi:hypothetical protein
MYRWWSNTARSAAAEGSPDRSRSRASRRAHTATYCARDYSHRRKNRLDTECGHLKQNVQTNPITGTENEREKERERRLTEKRQE